MKNQLFIIFFIIIILIISDCDSSEPAPVYQVQAVVINAGVTGVFAVTVLDLSGDTAEEVTDATVKINNTTVPYIAGEGYADSDGSLGVTLTAGANVHLVVETGELSLSKNVSVPEATVVTAPATGSYQNSALEIPVTWNALTSTPDELWVRIDGIFTTTGNSFDAEVATDATSYEIPALTIKSNQSSVYILVHALKVLDMEGDNLSSTSYFAVGNQGVSGVFHTSITEQ